MPRPSEEQVRLFHAPLIDVPERGLIAFGYPEPRERKMFGAVAAGGPGEEPIVIPSPPQVRLIAFHSWTTLGGDNSVVIASPLLRGPALVDWIQWVGPEPRLNTALRLFASTDNTQSTAVVTGLGAVTGTSLIDIAQGGGTAVAGIPVDGMHVVPFNINTTVSITPGNYSLPIGRVVMLDAFYLKVQFYAPSTVVTALAPRALVRVIEGIDPEALADFI